MPFLRQLNRLLVLTTLGVSILAITGLAANELAGGTGTTSRLYSFMHRVPREVDGHDAEYEIGRVYIVHRSRFIKPIHTVRFAVDWDRPATLVPTRPSAGGPTQIIAPMIDQRFPDVPPDIRAE